MATSSSNIKNIASFTIQAWTRTRSVYCSLLHYSTTGCVASMWDFLDPSTPYYDAAVIDGAEAFDRYLNGDPLHSGAWFYRSL